ncbi:MAG: NnrS family protein [Terriglobales bacterium]
MAAFPTGIESRTGKTLTPEEIFEIQRVREVGLSRLLMLYIVTGLAFMLLPGTFLGVWNLISISNRHAALSVSPSWIQAHGHAQIFGWIGTFILGIGFYSIPKLRRMEPFALGVGSATWLLWTAGVTLRWLTTVYLYHWRLLLPISSTMELLAFGLFFHAVSGHKLVESKSGPTLEKARFESWVLVVLAATFGFMGMLLANVGAAFYLALRGASPAFPAEFDQRYLALAAWGFMVPFVWGFSAKWLPIFLGLKPPRTRLLLATTALNGAGVVAALVGHFHVAAALLLGAAALSSVALRLWEATQQPAKTKFVHPSYPVFIRIAYVWLAIAAALGIWAAITNSPGTWGGSRHALTVGFIATMVFSVGQRVLPAFSGMRLLFSPRLMAVSLVLLTIGCMLRVSSEILAYQEYSAAAWNWLPGSAVIELSAVTVFAVNLFCTFLRPPVIPAVQPVNPAVHTA